MPSAGAESPPPAASPSTAPPPGEPPPDDADGALAAAWAQVEARWDDPEAHRRFLGLCAALSRLPEAGRRYRAVRDHHPEPARREAASRHIDALLAMAMRTLDATRGLPPDTGRARRILFLVAAALTVTLLVVAVLAWAR